MKSSGVMYLKFKDKFNQSAVATAWVFSLYTTFLLLLGKYPIYGRPSPFYNNYTI